MGYPMIDKFRRAITFGKPIQAWYRVPMTWDDDNWHIVVRPPSRHSVVIQDIDFHGDEVAACHVVLAYQQGGSFYEVDHVQCYYEHGKRTYVQPLMFPANAEFVVRRYAGGPAVESFTARGYFIRPAGAGAQRIQITGSYAYVAP